MLLGYRLKSWRAFWELLSVVSCVRSAPVVEYYIQRESIRIGKKVTLSQQSFASALCLSFAFQFSSVLLRLRLSEELLREATQPLIYRSETRHKPYESHHCLNGWDQSTVDESRLLIIFFLKKFLPFNGWEKVQKHSKRALNPVFSQSSVRSSHAIQQLLHNIMKTNWIQLKDILQINSS